MKNKLILDTSRELILIPWSNGIKLIKPLSDDNLDETSNTYHYSLQNIFNLPFHSYFFDKNSIILDADEGSIDLCGYASLKKAIGKTRALVAKKEVVDKIEREDALVIQNNQMNIFEEQFMLLNDISFPIIAFKYPWYDANNKIIGLFGISVVVSQNNLSHLVNAIKLIQDLGLLAKNKNKVGPLSLLPGKQINNVYLSKRESQCLNFIVKGKTAKEIAKILSLSPRTVEHYIENIKAKFNVYSKSELIERAIEYMGY